MRPLEKELSGMVPRVCVYPYASFPLQINFFEKEMKVMSCLIHHYFNLPSHNYPLCYIFCLYIGNDLDAWCDCWLICIQTAEAVQSQPVSLEIISL